MKNFWSVQKGNVNMHTMELAFVQIFNSLDPDALRRLNEILYGWAAASGIAERYSFGGINLTLHYLPSMNKIFRGIEVRIFIDFIKFFDSWKVEKSQVAIVRDALVRILTPLNIGIEEMKVKSIDYCFNFEILDREERMFLLKLWNKTYLELPKMPRIDPKKCETANKLYWIQGGYCNVQLYDKELERKSKKKTIQLYECNIMRLEVQIREKRIASQNRKFKSSTATPPAGRPDTFDAWTNWAVRAAYLSETQELFFGGDFYKLPRAKTQIQKAVKNGIIPSQAVAENIYSFMVDISNRGLDSAAKKRSAATVKKYIDLLSKIGVNPIPIPRHNKTLYLKNPLREFYEGGCVG